MDIRSKYHVDVGEQNHGAFNIKIMEMLECRIVEILESQDIRIITFGYHKWRDLVWDYGIMLSCCVILENTIIELSVGTIYCNVPYCTVLYCTVLYYFYGTVCVILYCTILYCTVLYSTSQYSTSQCSKKMTGHHLRQRQIIEVLLLEFTRLLLLPWDRRFGGV